MRKSVAGLVIAAAAGAGVLSACAPAQTAGPTTPTAPSTATATDVADLNSPGGPVTAMAAPTTAQPTSYAFSTVDDPKDPTFNQLLGINDDGQIAGYFGSGAAGHPNKGYQVRQGTSFVNENVPNSVQTQVTGINNDGVTVGFSSRANNANQVNDNTGFVLRGGAFHAVSLPTNDNAKPPVNQLLGINDDGMAAGFYTDAAGNSHGYTYDTRSGRFASVAVPGSTGVTAAAINDRDQIAGFDTTSTGTTEGFLRDANGKITPLAFPGASMTQALGLNNRGEVVGTYQAGPDGSATTHGFTWTAKGGFKTVDDPHGLGTTVNGLNDAGVLVGFYTDGAGNTNGMIAKPGGPTGGPVTEKLNLSAMPNGTVAVTRSTDGHYAAHIKAYGLTPGSTHSVEIDAPGATGPVLRFGTVTASGVGVADTTIDSVDSVGKLPAGARLVVRLGDNTGDFNRNAVAGETIAQSTVLPAVPQGSPSALNAVNQSTSGADLGHLAGTATVTYDPAKQTLTVTVNATGVGPGNHAAHIHNGTCQSQGSVRHMLMDYTADANGDIVNQTRTVTGVPTMPTPGSWYLNLHLGDSNSILTPAQQPALAFRPLLCANG